MTTIETVMTDQLVTCTGETPISAVAALMREHDIGDVLVVEGTQLRGIVTDRDLVVRGLADAVSLDSPVTVAASTDVTTVGPDASISDTLDLMRERALRRVPVVDANGALCGIVTLGDLAERQAPQTALGEISAAAPNN